MVRLRTVSPSKPGWTRRRVPPDPTKTFVYLDLEGAELIGPDAERCIALVIPPAWEEVWICPLPNGHIQAVGTDEAGRRQYRYHEAWRIKRDAAKHERVLEAAANLPDARKQARKHLRLEGMPRERALGAAFRLLDLGFFRIGGEAYAEENHSYGLATIRREHVSFEGRQVVFDYIAKSGKERYIALVDEPVTEAVRALVDRDDDNPELLAYQAEDGTWHDVTSTEINAYVKDIVRGEVSAKDFRTWHGTVIAACELAERVREATTDSKRKRAVSATMKEVSTYLGNTPAVARSSYVDPRLVDLFNDGITIDPALVEGKHDLAGGTTHGRIEQDVLRLLTHTKRELRKELDHLQ
ncbi:DNA topoisomerase IB [Microlunatus antarcticus]